VCVCVCVCVVCVCVCVCVRVCVCLCVYRILWHINVLCVYIILPQINVHVQTRWSLVVHMAESHHTYASWHTSIESQQTAAHSNTPQHTATHCNTHVLSHSAPVEAQTTCAQIAVHHSFPPATTPTPPPKTSPPPPFPSPQTPPPPPPLHQQLEKWMVCAFVWL